MCYFCDAPWKNWRSKWECPSCLFVAKHRPANHHRGSGRAPLCPQCRGVMIDRGFAWRPAKKAKR